MAVGYCRVRSCINLLICIMLWWKTAFEPKGVTCAEMLKRQVRPQQSFPHFLRIRCILATSRVSYGMNVMLST